MSKSGTTNIPNSLQEHWMPFTSNKDFKKEPRLITEGKGIYLKTTMEELKLMQVQDYSVILWDMAEKK